ncbi:hypothetical protein AMQ84_10355 [Paenibacillus riograndensis]|uniref:Uncharacterized protein n=1 Tax=Paenibacillus riograndensis TaxID=483937 RepID=A0A132U3P2_9BACL|nr:hypothetical protein [Paenibacillus riograndensis]KWX78120.1 hypothetical protein AMQ84_10355 [Paenibacillus riograndensis]
MPELDQPLPEVTELNLYDNQFSSIPEEVLQMPNLEIPESLLEIKGLERLDLCWNHELNLPGWLHKLEANGCIVYL